MKYPCLVQKSVCKTDITITLHGDEVNEDGTPIVVAFGTIKCNYQDSAKTVYTADKKQLQLTGVVLAPGDICPELATISAGEAVVFGAKRRIHKGAKVRNPDGTVNYCRLELI